MSRKNVYPVLLSLMLTQQAFTQQTDTTHTNQLDPVVVTANKYEQKQSTTGKVITLISREQLDKNNGRTLAQVLNDQAGITINGALNAPGSNQTVFLRGAASGRTLILIDGIPAYDPSNSGNEFDLNLLSITDVERVEICKGAQSTLYGSDAIAGVINIITVNKEAAKLLNLRSTLSGGNLGTFKGNAQVYGKAGSVSYSARYAKILTNGFSAAYDSSHKGNFDKDGYNGNILNAQVQWQANSQLSFRGFVQYNRYKTDIDAGGFTDDRDYTLSTKNFTTGGGFRYKKEFLTLTGNYQYSDIKRNYLDDSASVGGFAKFSKNDYYGKTQFAELYTGIGLGRGFTLLQGADYRNAHMNNQYLSISDYGPYSSNFKDTSLSQSSLYSSLNYVDAGNVFSVELGGRLNVHSRYGSNYTYTFNPAVHLSRHLKLFGSIASGFKAPSLYQLYDAFSGNRNLQPEKSTNYEIGFQHQQAFISNRLVFFYRSINNGIDYNYVSQRYFNFAQQIVRGLEWEMTVRPFKILTIQGNYTYLSAEEQTANRLTLDKDTAYHYSLRRPKHTLNVNAALQLTHAFYVGASVKYVTDRFDIGGYQAPDLLLHSYTLLGAHANYQLNNNLQLFVDLQNITSKQFFDVNGYNSIPFLFTGGLTIHL